MSTPIHHPLPPSLSLSLPLVFFILHGPIQLLQKLTPHKSPKTCSVLPDPPAPIQVGGLFNFFKTKTTSTEVLSRLGRIAS